MQESEHDWLQCPICHEQLVEPLTQPCQHTFCRLCLLRRAVEALRSDAEEQLSCPVCQRRAYGLSWAAVAPENYALRGCLIAQRGEAAYEEAIAARRLQDPATIGQLFVQAQRVLERCHPQEAAAEDDDQALGPVAVRQRPLRYARATRLALDDAFEEPPSWSRAAAVRRRNRWYLGAFGACSFAAVWALQLPRYAIAAGALCSGAALGFLALILNAMAH